MAQKKKNDPLEGYDPNAPGIPGKLFGLPFNVKNSQLVVMPVPWDVTVSYAEGTSAGPEAVIQASSQIDLYDPETNNAWRAGICADTFPEEILKQSKKLRRKAAEYIRRFEKGQVSTKFKEALIEMNAQCLELNKEVYERTHKLLKSGKIPAVLGGDHSTPLGLMLALSEKYKKGFGILQIDAHADLRKAYEGFEFSHASIMYNALKIPQVKKLVQVGIRDYCEEEAVLIGQKRRRIKTFFDSELQTRKFEGKKTWRRTCEEIVSKLPSLVYISFDIDGLDPKLCPNTGTPVPGGLEFSEAVYLLQKVVDSGRKIIGFDLCEVNPGETEWDANVGARMLFKLASFALVSQKH